MSIITFERKPTISEQAAKIINEIEGENRWRIIRAEERAKMGDYSKLDVILAQKEVVRLASNEAEELSKELTAEEVNNFVFTVDLSEVKAMSITRITVGAFLNRFTDKEYGNIKAAAESVTSVDKALFVLQGRTHVDVTVEETRKDIEAFKDSGLLGDVIDIDNYSDRVDELLQQGNQEEAYRGE